MQDKTSIRVAAKAGLPVVRENPPAECTVNIDYFELRSADDPFGLPDADISDPVGKSDTRQMIDEDCQTALFSLDFSGVKAGSRQLAAINF